MTEAEFLPLSAADLNGKPIGAVFLGYIFHEPEIEALRERLCKINSQLSRLFKGAFPARVRSKSAAYSERPRCATVGNAHLKSYGRSFSGEPLVSPSFRHPLIMIDWDFKWQLSPDVKETLRTALQTICNRRADHLTLKTLIDQTVEILAQRYLTLLRPLRSGQLIAEGIHKLSGHVQPLSPKEWDRPDRYLDVERSDLLAKTAQHYTALWESITLRAPQPTTPLTPRSRPQPADQALEQDLKKLGFADGRHGKSDYQIACLIVDRRGVGGQPVEQVIDRTRKQVKRYYDRRGLT